MYSHVVSFVELYTCFTPYKRNLRAAVPKLKQVENKYYPV